MTAAGEQLAYAIERLMKAGARDASCFPIFMKKNPSCVDASGAVPGGQGFP